MSFSRRVLPARVPDADEVTSMLAGIGFRLAAEARHKANIEDSLFFASVTGMDGDDLRILAVLTTWMEVHYRRVNADRLVRLVVARGSMRVKAFWAAVGMLLERDRRFARLSALHCEDRVPLLHGKSTFLLERAGEDPRFSGSPLIVPKGVLRARKSDVLTPEELASTHRVYRWRIIVGPTYRADMLALLDEEPDLSPSEVAHRTYGSFATAHAVKRDRETIRQGSLGSLLTSPPNKPRQMAAE